MLSDETRERLKMEQDLVIASHSHWESQITSRAERLKFLCSRDNTDDYEEISRLEEEIQLWQRRGEIETSILNSYAQKTNKILWNNLCSGLANLKL